MNAPREPEIARTVPMDRALLFIFGGTVLGIIALVSLESGGWPLYVLVPLGGLVGGIVGGIVLGITAGLKARRADADEE